MSRNLMFKNPFKDYDDQKSHVKNSNFQKISTAKEIQDEYDNQLIMLASLIAEQCIRESKSIVKKGTWLLIGESKILFCIICHQKRFERTMHAFL